MGRHCRLVDGVSLCKCHLFFRLDIPRVRRFSPGIFQSRAMGVTRYQPSGHDTSGAYHCAGLVLATLCESVRKGWR